MKKLSSIIFALAALSFAAVSCQEEEIFQPGEPEESGCYGVYFPVQEASGSHTLTPDDPTSVDIIVKRANASGSVSDVPYVVTSSDESVFSFGSINFADGQDETSLHIDFPNATPGKTYSFTIQILDNKYASKYNDSAVALDYSFMIVEWKEFFGAEAKAGDLGHVYEISWEEDYDTQMFYYETSYPDIRFCKLVGAWQGNVETVDYEFYWNTKTNNLYVPHQWIGYTLSDGRDVYTGAAPDFYDKYNGWGEVVPSDDYFSWAPAWITKNGFFQPFYDGNGNFYLGDWLYLCTGGIPTGSGYQFGGDSEADADLYMAPGFIRTDYSIEAESDYSVSGSLPLYLTAGYDVASIKYAFFPGSLTATQVANKVSAVIAGTEDSEEIVLDAADRDEDGFYYLALDVTLPETGAYTFVAVSYDAEGNAKENASGEAYYVASGDVADNLVELTVSAEDTPSRYVGYHDYDSFAYYVCGQALTDVHIAVVDASKLSNEVLNTVKSDDQYAVSEEVLAKINGVGGYYNVVKVNANTTYAVVVWATNGSLDTTSYVLYTTAHLPYVWNSLGKGIYVDDIVAPMYGMPAGMTAPCDVFEEKSHPGLYKISGFQLPFVAEIFDTTEEEMALYEGGNWENAEIIIDAQNPNAVKIEEQFMGICLNSSDGWFYVTSMLNGAPFSNGTLANGEITFPVKGLLIALDDDGYYYGNKSGMFKVVLPSAAATAVVPSYPAGGHKYEVKFAGDFAKAKNTVFEREISAVSFSAAKGTPRLDSSSKKAEIKYGVEKLNF